jgi:hypothetical protein
MTLPPTKFRKGLRKPLHWKKMLLNIFFQMYYWY